MQPMTDKHLAILRRHMVEVIGIHYDVLSQELGKAAPHERVAAALLRVPRHRFVPELFAALAYQDTPLPIGFEKTISQPFIAALMIDFLDPQPDEVVLEVGTGLGYQAAVLGALSAQVWSVEVVEELATEAETRLKETGAANVGIRVGDGSRGWAEHMPFDKIMLTAAAKAPPAPLLEQLKPGGRMVLPIGPAGAQMLTIVDKTESGELKTRELIPVRFTELEIA